jgi:hypothetical protein
VATSVGLQQDVDDVPVLVDGAPEVLALTANRDEQLVEMPGVAERSGSRPKVSDQWRIVSYDTVMPRSARRPSTGGSDTFAHCSAMQYR